MHLFGYTASKDSWWAVSKQHKKNIPPHKHRTEHTVFQSPVNIVGFWANVTKKKIYLLPQTTVHQFKVRVQFSDNKLNVKQKSSLIALIINDEFCAPFNCCLHFFCCCCKNGIAVFYSIGKKSSLTSTTLLLYLKYKTNEQQFCWFTLWMVRDKNSSPSHGKK